MGLIRYWLSGSVGSIGYTLNVHLVYVLIRSKID